MKVIFLDIDGVLNNDQTFGMLEHQHRALGEHAPCECFSPRNMFELHLVARLNEIVRRTSAQVVISSSWRKLVDLGGIAEILALRGFMGEVVGETPDLVNDPVWLERFRFRTGAPLEFERVERGHEIWEWLTLHPEVTHFVILDDCSDMARLKAYLVHTDADVGLDEPDVERAAHLMERSTSAIAVIRKEVWP
jgi:hypothetical protein